MRTFGKARWLVCGYCCILHCAFAFEGRIHAVMTRGKQSDALLYTVASNFLRVEMTATNWPNPVDILDCNTGDLTLLFPNNRSFVRLKALETSSVAPPGMSVMPNLPAQPAIALTNLPAMPPLPPMPPIPNMPPGAGPPSTPRAPAVPAMPGISGGLPPLPIIPPPRMGKVELRDTGQTTNLLGFVCEHYEIKQRGETMEIWATAQLFPFQLYVQNQPHRFSPRLVEDQWAELLKAKKLFPLRAALKFDNGAELLRFEVQSVTPQALTDEDTRLFQPPPGYFEIQPLPF